MKKLIICTLLSSQLFAQQLTKLPYPNNAGKFIVTGVGSTQSGFKVTTSQETSPDQWTYRLAECDTFLHVVKESPMEVSNIFTLQGADSLNVTEVVMASDTSLNLITKTYDVNGKASGSWTWASCSINGTGSKHARNYKEFENSNSPDRSKFLWYYGGNKIGGANAFVEVKIFDRSRSQPLYSKKIVFPYKDENFYLEKGYVSNDGGIFFIARALKKPYKLWQRETSITKDHDLLAFYYDPVKDRLSEQMVFNMGQERVNFLVQYNPISKCFDMIGLYSVNGFEYKPTWQGMYYYSYTPQNNFLEKKTVNFDTTLLVRLVGKKQAHKGGRPTDIALDRWVYFKDGEVCLLGHQNEETGSQNMSGYTLNTSPTNGSWNTYMPTYSYQTTSIQHNILCIVIGKNGENKVFGVLPAAYSKGNNCYVQVDEKQNAIAILSHSTTGFKESQGGYQNYARAYKEDSYEPNKIFLTKVTLQGIQTQAMDEVDYIDRLIINAPDRRVWYFEVRSGDKKEGSILKIKY